MLRLNMFFCFLFLFSAFAQPAQAAPRLTHSISGCSALDRPTAEERRVQRELQRCASDMQCRHQAVKALPGPLRRCYLRPTWDEKKRETCLKKSRAKAFVEARAEKGRIRIRQRLRTYCKASDKISFRLKQKGSTLTLREIFRAKTVARCVCPYDIRATIQGLKPGSYSLKIVFDNRYAKDKESIHEVELQVL